MNDGILRIGEIVEVRGQKVRSIVYKDKNSLYINYKGSIVKNICVGGFVKIKNGFDSIIGKIEGEYITQDKNLSIYKNNRELLIRILEISIVGRVDSNGVFTRGLTELPLVGNYVYVLKEEEIEKIFSFSKRNETKVKIGNIISYENYKLRLSVQQLFASHIGIFGNTGSGKSNTLAKLYSELFDIYCDNVNFNKNSKFLLIDFNGEYGTSITNKKNKKIYKLSTREEKDKYPLNKEYLFELEFWSIITEATEKTQRPFLKACIKNFNKIIEGPSLCSEIVLLVKNIIKNICNYGEKYGDLRKYYDEIIDLGFNEIKSEDRKILNLLSYNKNNSTFILRNNGNNQYLNNPQQFCENTEISKLINEITEEKCLYNSKNIDYIDLFYFIVKLNYLTGLQRGFINEEHIAPLIKRLDIRLNDVKKVFIVNEKEENDKPLNVVSLLDVNLHMRKIIPMILCKREYDEHKKYNKNKFLNIIVDEAHNILSDNSERESSMWKDYRLEIFEEIIKEGRKFGTFLTISSQRPSDISDTIISQLHNYFLHRLVNNEDIRAIGKSVSFLDNASYEMIPILPQGACIFTGMASNFPVLVQVDMLDNSKKPKSETIKLNSLWAE